MEARNSSSVPKESEPRIRAEFRDRVQARLVQNGESKLSSEMNLPEVARSRPAAVRHVERTEEEPFLSGHSWPWLELTWVVGFVAALTPAAPAIAVQFVPSSELCHEKLTSPNPSGSASVP
jgi:hypothetical protein